MFQAVENASALIMSTACDVPGDGFPTVVVGNDTALLVRLIRLAKSIDNIKVFMLLPGKG